MQHKSIVLLVLLVFVTSVARAQSEPVPNSLRLYDNFDGVWLDPAKWAPVPTCSETQFLHNDAPINVVDCVRATNANKLRLMVRAHGNSESDTDSQLGPSEAYFADPEEINTINVSFRVTDSTFVACPSNNNDSVGQVLIGGNFFNSGSGSPQDDVTAFLLVQRGSTSSDENLVAGAAVFSKNIYHGWVSLGTPDLSGTLYATLAWDRPNHRFRFRLATASGDHSGDIPYIGSDSAAPADPMKLLAARAFVPNCTTQATSASVNALFDSVFVNE